MRPLLLVVLFAALAAPVLDAGPAAPTNDDCLTCHEAPALFKSVHGEAGLACTDCHADLARTTEFPHAEKLAKAGLQRVPRRGRVAVRGGRPR